MIGAWYYGTGALTFEPGVPNPTVTIRLTDAASMGSSEGALNIDSGKPMTVVDTMLYAIDPEKAYIVEFFVTYSVVKPDGIPAGEGMVGYATIKGHQYSNNHDHTFYNQGQGINGIPLKTASAPLVTDPAEEFSTNPMLIGSAEFSMAQNRAFDIARVSPENVDRPILGTYLDGSVWTLVVYSHTTYAGTNAYYGSTTVTINMDLGAENLSISVGDVSVQLAEG